MNIQKNNTEGLVSMKNFERYLDELLKGVAPRIQNKFLFRAAVIYHLLEIFENNSFTESMIINYFSLSKNDIENIKNAHPIRLRDDKYKKYQTFYSLLKSPPKQASENINKIRGWKIKAKPVVVINEDERKYAEEIMDDIFKHTGTNSIEELIAISKQGELMSYRGIALILFTQKYPKSSRSNLLVLFEKLKVKNTFHLCLKRHENLLHKINDTNKFAIWHRQTYDILSSQNKTATSQLGE